MNIERTQHTEHDTMTPRATPCTLDELDALLSAASPADDRPAWLRAVCALGDVTELEDHELVDIASEADERGAVQTAAGLIEALRVRHAHDRVTLAILAALDGYRIPSVGRSQSGGRSE